MTTICDCERGHNGLGLATRKCDCEVKVMSPTEEAAIFQKSWSDAQIKIDTAIGMAFMYADIDGSHHKTWLIDQMIRRLTGEGYDMWVKVYERQRGEWDTGVAP